MTIETLADDLEAGRTTSRALVDICLARIADEAGEGARVFVRVDAQAARAQADAIDMLRACGRAPGRLAGIPISLKDLLDVAGQVTTAGSMTLTDTLPAKTHAPVVARLLTAGMVPVGRTNMTEFAFSGMGLNPHFGTPANPWDRTNRRIPGGSSSGAAVSVADGMAIVAIGTDTGGSCRVPAALCGVVGFKPTQRRVPLAGAWPLSPSLDSIGPIAQSVADCAAVDAVLAGDIPAPLADVPLADVQLADVQLAGRRFVIPAGWADDLASEVETAFEAAVDRLRAAGAVVEERAVKPFDAVDEANARGNLTVAEAWARHETRLERDGYRYDPFVRRRIERGASMTAADLVRLTQARAKIIADMEAEWAGMDALLLPTCPIVAPRIADLIDLDEAARVNARLLRGTSAINFVDGCSISLPCHAPGTAPVGLMLSAGPMGDRRLLALALAVERLLGR